MMHSTPDTPCDSTVAKAAPNTPMLNTRMKRDVYKRQVYRTRLQISVPPMEKASYEVPVTLKNSMIDVEKEYCLVVSFVLKENTIWEKAGYEIAFGQHRICLLYTSRCV